MTPPKVEVVDNELYVVLALTTAPIPRIKGLDGVMWDVIGQDDALGAVPWTGVAAAAARTLAASEGGAPRYAYLCKGLAPDHYAVVRKLSHDPLTVEFDALYVAVALRRDVDVMRLLAVEDALHVWPWSDKALGWAQTARAVLGEAPVNIYLCKGAVAQHLRVVVEGPDVVDLDRLELGPVEGQRKKVAILSEAQSRLMAARLERMLTHPIRARFLNRYVNILQSCSVVKPMRGFVIEVQEVADGYLLYVQPEAKPNELHILRANDVELLAEGGEVASKPAEPVVGAPPPDDKDGTGEAYEMTPFDRGAAHARLFCQGMGTTDPKAMLEMTLEDAKGWLEGEDDADEIDRGPYTEQDYDDFRVGAVQVATYILDPMPKRDLGPKGTK